MRVARETYVLLARFRDDKANQQKGEPPGSPFCFFKQGFRSSVGKEKRDGDGGACHSCAGDGGDRARMPDWLLAVEVHWQWFAKWIAQQ